MTYNIYEIELNGETNISRFGNKKEVQKYLNDNYYVIVDCIERETKKSVTDVTDQFEIQHFADSAESVEPEESNNYLEKAEELANIESDIIAGKSNDTIGLVDSLFMYIDNLRKLNPIPSFIIELIDKDIAWCKHEIITETATKKRLKKELDPNSQFFDEQYRITCKYIERIRNTRFILKRIKRLARRVTKWEVH